MYAIASVYFLRNCFASFN